MRDCELIRRDLLGPSEAWSVLGQSFGGFCATTYLSLAPESLDRVLITGGLPSLAGDPDLMYRTTYRKVLERNEEYYRRYPGTSDCWPGFATISPTPPYVCPAGNS